MGISKDTLKLLGIVEGFNCINPDIRAFKLPKTAKMINDGLYVVQNGHNFAFLEFEMSEVGSDPYEALYTIPMHGSGLYPGNLKECRHTWWGEDGYIYYPNKRNIVSMLDWIEEQGVELI